MVCDVTRRLQRLLGAVGARPCDRLQRRPAGLEVRVDDPVVLVPAQCGALPGRARRDEAADSLGPLEIGEDLDLLPVDPFLRIEGRDHRRVAAPEPEDQLLLEGFSSAVLKV